jgi:hypothetical protein
LPDALLGPSSPRSDNALHRTRFEQSNDDTKGTSTASTIPDRPRMATGWPVSAHRVRQATCCKGGIRTSVLSVVGLVVLTAIVLFVLARSLGPPEGAPQRTQTTEDASTSGTLPAPASSGIPSISGTISVSLELAGSIPPEAVLFIIAHKGAGTPFAVRRIVGPHFPLHYRLGPEDVMLAGAPFEGEVRLSVRISRTGSAGPAAPGDLEGERTAPVQVGARAADILINRVR